MRGDGNGNRNTTGSQKMGSLLILGATGISSDNILFTVTTGLFSTILRIGIARI
jgi:hypothetical protein